MCRCRKGHEGFTLVEILVALAMVGILTGLCISAVSSAKKKARRTICLNNLKQLSSVIRMYADDHNDKLPTVGNERSWGVVEFTALLKSEIGQSAPVTEHSVLACPDDRFHYQSTNGPTYYIPSPLHAFSPSNSSYWFNSANHVPNSRTRQGLLPGISGHLISAIRDPAKTVMIGDAPAWMGYSWHEPRRIIPPDLWLFDNALNMIGYVDGHVSYTKIHFDLKKGPSCYYDPPVGFEYKWSAE
jgi:prepilin-type N-terminal cleavage/methylation domain-containing protein